MLWHDYRLYSPNAKSIPLADRPQDFISLKGTVQALIPRLNEAKQKRGHVLTKKRRGDMFGPKKKRGHVGRGDGTERRRHVLNSKLNTLFFGTIKYTF